MNFPDKFGLRSPVIQTTLQPKNTISNGARISTIVPTPLAHIKSGDPTQYQAGPQHNFQFPDLLYQRDSQTVYTNPHKTRPMSHPIHNE